MDLLDALGKSFDHANVIVGTVRANQYGDRTPCDQWTVQTLVGHTLEVLTNMGRGARGEAPVWGSPFPDDITAEFRMQTAATLEAWRQRGTGGLVNVGPEPIPVQVAQTINLIDTTTHSWDIARATGQDPTLPDDLATMVLGIAAGFVTDELRERVGFNAPVKVADDADPTAKLVAFLGRQP